MKKNIHIIAVVAILVIVGVAFYGGMKYQQSKVPTRGGNQAQNAQGQFRGRVGAGGTAVSGDVLNVDASSLTVKLVDGSSKIILLSGKTTVSQATASATTDIKTGEKVMVFGTSNSDGSVTASNVQINPQNRGPLGQ